MQSQQLIQHTGSAELTIVGKNLKDTLRLLHDGVEYTPLASTENSVTFILGDNGINRVYVNSEYSFGVQISGVVVPEKMSGRVNAKQASAASSSGGTKTNSATVFSYCINYPFKANASYPYFRFNVFGQFEATDLDDFAFTNCELIYSEVDSNNVVLLNVSVTDATKPAYITYQGFIIAVFNYEN